MKFDGFPDNGGFVSVPNLCFSLLLEEVQSLSGLRCAFRAIFLIQRELGQIKFVTLTSLLSDSVLVSIFRSSNSSKFEEDVRVGIQDCTGVGIFLKLIVQAEGKQEELLFLNSSYNKEIIKKIQGGEIPVPKLARAIPIPQFSPQPNIFRLYEESIGILTPLIAERLKEIQEEFPEIWIEEALMEASRQNRMRLSYVEGILRRWRQDGRSHRTSRGSAETVPISEIFRRPSG